MEQRFRNVDTFSGKGAIARAFKGRGYRVARLDIELSPLDDTQMNAFISVLYIHVTMKQKLTWIALWAHTSSRCFRF